MSDRSTEVLLARRKSAENLNGSKGWWAETHFGLERPMICVYDDEGCSVVTDTSSELAGYFTANDPPTVTADIDEILRLRKENEKLKQDLEVAKELVASAQEAAKLAWGGEIPSPLPGHPGMSEDEVEAMFEHLNCPWCGGSGHVGDCDAADQAVKANLERLEKEADWLALKAIERSDFCVGKKCTTPRNCVLCLRAAAREAVENSRGQL